MKKQQEQNLELKNAELQKQLAEKNRDLEIEASLERVRTAAMAMAKPDDLLNICKLTYVELQALGFKAIRNSQIFIFDDPRGAFINYGFSDDEGANIAEIFYDSHPRVKEFITAVRKTSDAFAELSISGDELIAWRQYRIDNGEPDDSRLGNIDTLYYYFYSIGIGAIGISNFEALPEGQQQILKRFRNVFDLAYRRYADIQLAEAQAREAQIELGLERVRARAMAMQSSGELSDLVTTVFNELSKLDFSLSACIINIIDGESLSNTVWFTGLEAGLPPQRFHMKFEGYPFHDAQWIAWKEKKAKWVYTLEGQEKLTYDEYLLNETEFSRISDAAKADIRAMEKLVCSYTFCNFGGLQTVGTEPLSDANLDILARFGKVFDLTYTRFNDLKQAETQARESQIELALERVRARTMAMQHSDELSETAYILFQQFKELGENPDQATIGIINEEEHVIEYWVTMYGGQINKVFKFSIDEPNVTNKIYKGWKAHKKSLVIDLSGKALTDFAKYRESMGGARLNKGEKRRVINVAFFSKGLINVQSNEERSEESIRLLERFAGVFDGTYTRFLDLKKAEAQARESQIELALERVRAKTMAMQKSEELLETSQLVFQQLRELGATADQIGIAIVKEKEGVFELFATLYGNQMLRVFTPKIDDPFVMGKVYKGWKTQQKSFVVELSGEDLRNYNIVRNKLGGSNFYNENIGAEDRWIVNCASFSKGILSFSSSKEPASETTQLLERFAKVFEQTYTRFLDLQKAEAQAKEAQIELALERVRARTMAMQKSEELKEIIKVVYEQLVHLNILAEHAGFIMDYRANDDMQIWLTDKHFDPSYVTVPYFDSPHWNSFNEAKKKGNDFFAVYSTFEEKNKFYQDLFALVPGVTDEAREYYLNCPGLAISTVLLDNVALYIENFSGIPYTDEENNTLMRFGKVFQQTYTRFLDLQKAEAQAREAQIELSLERVRASAMAMHKTDQLLDAAELLYRELTSLGINSMAITYAIMAGDEKSAAYYSINPVDGKLNPVPFDLSHTETEVMRFILSGWKKQEAVSKLVLDEEATLKHQTYIAGIVQAHFAENNFDQPFSVEAFLEISPKKAVIYAFNFAQGYIFIIGSEHLTKSQEEMVMRFTKVFEMTYRRFLDLKKAEAQTREGHIQLGLERVRAKAMAMQNSEEINELIGTVFTELTKLDFVLTRCLIMIFDPETRASRWWMANSEAAAEPMNYLVQNHKNPAYDAYLKAWKGRNLKWNYALKGKVKRDWDDFLFVDTELAQLPGPVIEGMKAPEQVLLSASFNNFGCLTLVSLEPLSDEHSDIMLRFAKVFDMSYTRYNDLKQAEAQARESQIQLALERVRARTMAMQKSEELHEVIQLVFDQLQQLNFNIDNANFALNYKETDDLDLWLAAAGAQYATKICIPYFSHPIFDRFNKVKGKGGLFADTLSFDEKNSFFEHFFKHTPDVANERKAFIFEKPGFARSAAFMKNTALTIINYQGIPYSEAENNTLLRFGQVFDQTYTRFTDLKQAEEQAREAKIEASLERVRSRTMAMQHSDELRDVIQVIYEQLHQLNFNIDSADFNLDYRDTDDFNLWIGVPGQPYPAKMHVPYIDHPVFNRIVKSKGKVPAVISDCYTSDQKNTYFRHNFKFSTTPIPAERQDFIFSGAGLAISTVLMTNVALSTLNYSGVPYTDADNATLMRFGNVFEQTYTRFKDLEQAEEQAREAQIQLGLERVRARAMAMQSSGELAEVVDIVFKELTKLDFGLTHCAIAIADADSVGLTLWQANSEPDQPPISFYRKSFDHPYPNAAYKEWKKRTPKWVYHLKGAEKKAMHDYYASSQETMYVPNAVKQGMAAVDSIILSHSFNNFGYLRTDTMDPLSENNLDIVYRFAKAFDLCYTRFTDIKQAEAQAKESQIQLALERVRARTMAMQKSEELAETASVLFQQLLNLGISSERTFIAIPNDDTRKFELWGTQQGGNQMSTRFEYEADATYAFREIYKAWQEKRTELTVILKGKNLEEHVNYVRNVLHMPLLAELVQKQRILYNAFFSKGLLMIVTPDMQSKETLEILERFAGVFDGTYTRFLDLQRAEAQVREAQIEAALERVRSKTMAMHSSGDVGDTVATMFNELLKLGVEKTVRCGIAILDETRMMELWTATLGETEKAALAIGHIDMHIHPMLMAVYDSWKRKDSGFSYELIGDDLSAYINAINNYPDYPVRYDLNLLGPKQFHSDFFFPEGMLFAFTSQPLGEEISLIFKRFAGVFGQTYRRYLDLLKAEAAAREAQIEAALERVRSKTMAMHNSQDVGDTVGVMFQEFVKLGIEKMIRCGIGIMSHENRTMELWTAKWGENEKVNLLIGHLDMTIHKMLGSIYDAWKSKQSNFTYHLAGSDLVSYAKVINSYPDYPLKYDLNSLPPAQFFNDFFFNEGVVFAFTSNSLSDEIVTVLKRFAGVFGQTYRRYLDLQKAENQAREAQIEAALERVRGKAMAMYTSADLSLTTGMVFSELRKLGIVPLRCGVILPSKDSPVTQLYVATPTPDSHSLDLTGTITLSGHWDMENQYQAWQKKENYFTALKGQELKSYKEVVYSMLPVPYSKSYHEEFGYYLYFSEGFLFAWAGKPFSESELNILNRFKAIIDLTFRRYIELQKSEANTKEAIKQASLDRVRAEIASMRKRNDLERITPLIWDELNILGIPFIRCGVFIMDEEQQLIHTFLSTPDGKAIGAFHVPFDTSGNFEKMVDSWRHGVPYIDHWEEEAFSQFADTLLKQGAIASKAQYMRTLPHEGIHLNFLPFLQGMLYVGNIEPLTEDNISLIQAVAEAFSTAYARYEDFNKLEAAKQQVDNTLSDLKATQTKLIQSEKMASLGELTAGIAHEIQNPLNFVNNFSEVNQEMLEELKAESLKPKAERDEQLEIDLITDLIENEQKINHHGKRADAIVKGMLQHSRTGGGEKQPTNINALADEFMRLSYHGLRAKDKGFNAEMVTHFDPDLPKINVIGQDIGRVLLNLFNNAFYAVNQKKKALNGDYKPEVTVTTLTENGQVIIKVKDNGVGMPEHIKEKIMQPFFTTKPTGEGTGLGLSLTYDMVVKGHGGNIQVNSVEGEGSEFIIQLPIK